VSRTPPGRTTKRRKSKESGGFLEETKKNFRVRGGPLRNYQSRRRMTTVSASFEGECSGKETRQPFQPTSVRRKLTNNWGTKCKDIGVVEVEKGRAQSPVWRFRMGEREKEGNTKNQSASAKEYLDQNGEVSVFTACGSPQKKGFLLLRREERGWNKTQKGAR